MHSTVFFFNHIKQSWETTWQTKNIKGRCNAIIALFTIISGSFEEGGDPINTLTNNSHQESIVAILFRTLYEDTPPHLGHERISDPIFTPTVTLMIQYGPLFYMYLRSLQNHRHFRRPLDYAEICLFSAALNFNH